MVEEMEGHYAGKMEEGAAGTMTDIEKAIVEFEDFLGEKGPGNLHISSVITALTVLREKAEREKQDATAGRMKR